MTMSIEESRQHRISDVRRSLSFDSVTAEDSDAAGNERTSFTTAEQIPAEVQLRSECESLWKELNNTQARLETRPGNHTFETDGEEFGSSKILERVLRAKGTKLQTELLALENQGLEVLSTNPESIQTFLQDQLVNSIKQLEETLQVIKGHRQELHSEMNQEEDIIDQHKKVNSALQNKIEALEEEKENVHGFTSQLHDLERKKKSADKYLKTTMKQLGSFLSENYPLPSTIDMKGKQQSKVALDPNTRYVSLQQLTEDLMNLLYSRPHDPYLQIKKSHWPPYLELLLRSGVAQRHPQDCNRIRLVAFNH